MRLLVSSLLIALATPALAQIPSASATAFATGNAFVARARGFNAVAWNPAGLGMVDNPRFSATVASVQAIATLGPIGLSDFKEFEGDTVPLDVRESWLREIEDAGGQSGGAAAGLTTMALSVGPLAFHLGTAVNVMTRIGPGAAELLFFGNAGRTGEPRTISGAGSAALASATSTMGVSFGRAITKGGRRIAVGATVKYTIGHMLATAEDSGTRLSGSPVEGQLSFPLIQSNTAGDIRRNLNNGNGIGVDVGVASSSGAWRYGLAVQNIVNGFKWDASKFTVRFNQLDIATRRSDFDEYPLSDFPEYAAGIEKLTFKPVIAAGGAYEGRKWTGALDVRRRTDEDGLEGGPMTQVGAGVELRPLRWLPLMLGTSWSSDALILSGGLGLRLGSVSATVAGGFSRTDFGSDPLVAFTLSAGTR